MSGDSADRATGRPDDLQMVAMERFIRPLGICAMLACIAISIGQFARVLWPDAPVSLGVALAFLVSLESIWAHRVLARRGVGRQDRARFRFVEWVVLLLLARFAPYLHLGGARLAADLDRWALQPGSFFGIEFLGLAGLMACFWGVALYLARNIDELEAAPWEEQVSTRSDDYYMRSTMPQHGQTNRQVVLDRITTVYYVGGALLLIMAGLARLDYTEGFPRSPASGSGVVLNAVLYFFLGLLLISQAQYTIQRARWQIQRVPILDRIGRRWFITVLALLLTITLISALLPTGYSVGILQTLSTVLLWLVFGIGQVFYMLVFGIGALISWLASLLGIEFSRPEAPLQRPPPMPIEDAVGAGAPAWWSLVRSILFWGMLSGIALYALLTFARDRWGALAGFSLRRWLNAFFDLWRGLRGGAREVWGALNRSVRASLARLFGGQERVRASWRPRLGGLSPQGRIRYYYLSVLHRAERQGFGRPPTATPFEYRERLARELPEAGVEVDTLTQDFVEARYSAHDLTDEHASGVARVWRALRRALAVRRRGAGERSPRTRD